MRTRIPTTPWLVLGLLAALGCRGPAVWQYEEALERTPEPAAHAIHDERLAVLMRELDRLRSERLPKPLDLREAEERQAREISQVAQAMAESATRIPAAAPANLTANSRADFQSLAETLQRLCLQLAEQAPRLSAEQRRAQLAEIDATCHRCHSRFRIPGIANDDD